MWSTFVGKNITTIIVDTNDGVVVATLSTHTGRQEWGLSGDFLSKIPNINDYDPLDPTNDETTNDFNLDQILSLISDNGYESLTKEQKIFLDKESKK